MLLRCEDSVRMEAGFRKYVHREVDHKRLAEKEKKKKKKETPGQPLNGSWDSWIPAMYWTRPRIFFVSKPRCEMCLPCINILLPEWIVDLVSGLRRLRQESGRQSHWQLPKQELCRRFDKSIWETEIEGTSRDPLKSSWSCCSRWNGPPVCTHLHPFRDGLVTSSCGWEKGFPFIFTDFPWIRGLGRRRRRRSWGMEARCCEQQWHNLYKISICPGLKMNFRWLL